MTKELHLRLVTPDRVVIDRKVASVQFMGMDGSYGILPGHAALVTALADVGIVSIKNTDGTTEDIFASGGFAEVSNNVLSIVSEAGERADEIDLERAAAAEKKARESMAKMDRLSKEFLKAEASLRRAMAREMLARKNSGSGSIR